MLTITAGWKSAALHGEPSGCSPATAPSTTMRLLPGTKPHLPATGPCAQKRGQGASSLSTAMGRSMVAARTWAAVLLKGVGGWSSGTGGRTPCEDVCRKVMPEEGTNLTGWTCPSQPQILSSHHYTKAKMACATAKLLLRQCKYECSPSRHQYQTKVNMCTYL